MQPSLIADPTLYHRTVTLHELPGPHHNDIVESPATLIGAAMRE